MKTNITLLTALLATLLVACSKDEYKEEEAYPSIITEFVDLHSDAEGLLATIQTDNGTTYRVGTTISGFRANSGYRGVCGFVPQGDVVSIYQLQPAQYLRDSSAVVRHDPVDVYSVWCTKRYLNLHLNPLTQGGTQRWGFAIDSLSATAAHLSLHHAQCGDPAAYHESLYASIPIDSIPNHASLDSILLTIHTFQQPKTWAFKVR